MAPRLSTVSVTTDLTFETPLRPGELVWVYMGAGISSSGSPRVEIRWWPAFLRSVAGAAQGNRIQVATPPRTYTVQMLGLLVQYAVPRRCILPYQAYAVPIEVFQALRGHFKTYRRTHGQQGQTPSLTSNFLPLTYTAPLSILPSPNVQQPPEPSSRFDSALEPLLVGIVAAHRMAAGWSLPGRCLQSERPDVFERVETMRDTLWWGPECIRIGDLVRLTHRRSALPPPFSPHVEGAHDRAPILAIQTISLSRPRGGESMAPVPIVGGRVYEIVDLKPSEAANPQSSSMFVYSQFPPRGCALRSILPSDDDYAYFGARAIEGRYYADAPRWTEPFQNVDPLSRSALAGLTRRADSDRAILHFTAKDRTGEVYSDALEFATTFWKNHS